MLKLKIQKEPYWLEIGSGVKVKVKPCTSAVFYEAKAYMNNAIAENAEALQDAKAREAFADEQLIIGLALAGIIEWDGVLEAEGDTKAPPTPKKIKELFANFWVLAENFRQQYCGIKEIMEAEKNASTSVPNGTSVTEEPIVKDVESKKPSATSKSAATQKQP